MIDYKAAYAIAEQIKAYRATPGNAPQILELLNRLAGEFDNDAKTTEFLAREGLKDMADTFFRFRESIKWKEYTQQRPPARRSSEVVEPPKPRPHVRPQGAYLADFGHHAAREEAGGRFAAVNTFVSPGEIPQYPRQPANSPWAPDLVGNEPALGYEINAMPGQEPMKASPTTDELLKEIARLRAALAETQSGVSAPVRSAVADAASAGGEQVEASGPLSADFLSAQKEEPHG